MMNFDDDGILRVQLPAPKPKASKPKGKRAGTPSGRFRLINRFWKHPDTPGLSHAAQALWCYLWALADRKRECYPSNARIARRLGCCTRYAQARIRELVSGEYLAIVRPGRSRNRQANLYRLRLPGVEEIGAPELPKGVNPSAPQSYHDHCVTPPRLDGGRDTHHARLSVPRGLKGGAAE